MRVICTVKGQWSVVAFELSSVEDTCVSVDSAGLLNAVASAQDQTVLCARTIAAPMPVWTKDNHGGYCSNSACMVAATAIQTELGEQCDNGVALNGTGKEMTAHERLPSWLFRRRLKRIIVRRTKKSLNKAGNSNFEMRICLEFGSLIFEFTIEVSSNAAIRRLLISKAADRIPLSSTACPSSQPYRRAVCGQSARNGQTRNAGHHLRNGEYIFR